MNLETLFDSAYWSLFAYLESPTVPGSPLHSLAQSVASETRPFAEWIARN